MPVGERRGLAETHVHEDRVVRIHPTRNHDVTSVFQELTDRHLQRRQGTGTGRVNDAVRTSQVQSVGNPPGDDVPEHAREGVLFPRDVSLPDLLDDDLRILFGNPALPKNLPPERILQSSGQGGNELLPARNAQDNAYPVPVKVTRFPVARILQDLLGHHQRQQLRDLGQFEYVRGDTELHGIEIDLRQKGPSFTVGLIRGLGVRVVVVIHVPSVGRHVLDAVPLADDIVPEFPEIPGLREETGHPDHGDGGCLYS